MVQLLSIIALLSLPYLLDIYLNAPRRGDGVQH